MESIVLVIHMLASLVVVGLVLMQQGKGAEAGASFGAGASQTVFGSHGSASFLGKLTAAVATVFFVTSVMLAVFAGDKVERVAGAGIPDVTEEQALPVGDAPVPMGVEKNEEKGAADDLPVIDSNPVGVGDGDGSEADASEVPQVDEETAGG